MTERTAKLRRQSLDTPPSITGERARLMTEFYQANAGRFSAPVMRARAFLHLCQHKTIYLGEDELIVGERGPAPKVVPTFPELTCHSVEDLRILNSRPKTWYRVDEETIQLYEEKIIPYWRGRSMRDRMFAELLAGMARCLRCRAFHRVHGATRAGPHGPGRQDLRERNAGFQKGHRRGHGSAWTF